MTVSGSLNATVIDVVPIAVADLAWWIETIATLDWLFAITNADRVPLLARCDYSLDEEDRAVELVLEQAKLFASGAGCE